MNVLADLMGAVIGGAIAGLSVDAGTAGAGGIAMCWLSKALLMVVFVPIFAAFGVAGREKLWLSMAGSFRAGILLLMMVSMLTALNSGIMNGILCLGGGALFSVGLGTAGDVGLNKTSLVEPFQVVNGGIKLENSGASQVKNPLESESIGKLIMKYSLPAIASSLVSSIYNIVDQIFVGNKIGELGNAATNVAFPLVMIVTTLAMTVGAGSASSFSLCLGQQEKKKAKSIVGSGMTMMLLCGVTILAVRAQLK